MKTKTAVRMSVAVSFCVLSFRPLNAEMAPVDTSNATAAQSTSSPEAELQHQLQLLNQVPEDQLNEKTEPGFSIIKSIYDMDSPDFLKLRSLLGKTSVRGALNPSARAVLAGILSQRWDSFDLSGSLWLSGIRSPNPDLRERSRQKLVGFIKPAHVPILIDTLSVPGPNVAAYDILREITGQSIDPSVPAWRTWWKKTHGHFDIVGHLLKDTKEKLHAHAIMPFDQEKLWYLPEGIHDAQLPYARRTAAEQTIIAQWNDWGNQDVKRYVDDWAEAKPILDRLTHQPDPRINKFLETLVTDPGYGDYASVVLAWRSSRDSLPAIQQAYLKTPTVGRALARASLGDKTALADLLQIMERNPNPLSFGIMDENVRPLAQTVHTVGNLPAEQAFELLCHHSFDLTTVATKSDKKKHLKQARAWLKENLDRLVLDPRRLYYTLPTTGH